MATFTADVTPGKERDTIAFSAGGSTSTGLTVIVDSTAYQNAAGSGAKKLLLADLDRLHDRLKQEGFPPA